MEIIIAGYDLEPMFVIEEAKVLWCEKYQEPGEFELYFSDYDNTIVPKLKTEYYVMREDTDEAGIIEDVTIEKTTDEGTSVTITGRMATCLLERRIIMETVNLRGNLENEVYRLITENIINPDVTARKIPNFTLAEPKGLRKVINQQFTGKDLLTAITSVCVSAGYGFRVTVVDKKFVFEIYEGTDRSYVQDENIWMLFSEEYENLISSTLEVNVTTNRTFALVAGEGEGSERTKITLDSGATGIDRKELYVDARDLQSESKIEGEADLTEEEYLDALVARGQEKLNALATSVLFQGDIDISAYVYRKDFGLGDTVIVENESWGMDMFPQITEVLETYDENGYEVSLTYAE